MLRIKFGLLKRIIKEELNITRSKKDTKDWLDANVANASA